MPHNGRGIDFDALELDMNVWPCPCTRTTHAIPCLDLPARRPVDNCGLCYGLGSLPSDSWVYA